MNDQWNLKVKIKQVWVPYTEWEDFHAGMWRKVDSETEAEMLRFAVAFTGDHLKYGAAMREVVFAWPRTMLNSLTNPSINQRAFVGHCACCFKHSLPEYIVRMAWAMLTEQQRILANKEAENTIRNWKIWYTSKKNQQGDIFETT